MVSLMAGLKMEGIVKWRGLKSQDHCIKDFSSTGILMQRGMSDPIVQAQGTSLPISKSQHPFNYLWWT